MPDGTPVLVTTQHRGVFFGRLTNYEVEREKRTVTLQNCRNVIYWSGARGFLGLAAHGPENGSRVGSVAPVVLLHDVTSVTLCTDTATKVFDEWKS
jgi:hypothetical protein